MKAVSRIALTALMAMAAPVSMAQVAGKSPEQAWTWFLSNASNADVGELYSALNSSGYVRSRVTAESCRAGEDGLKRVAEKVPVSLALHRALQLCAEIRGDKAAADAEVTAFAALWKYAERQAGSGAWRRPLRIVVLNDAYAALDAMGLEFSYEFYEGVRAHGSFPIDIAEWDPERKLERHFHFDYVTVQAAIDRKNSNAGTAAHLNGTANEFVEAYDKAGELSARDVKAVNAATEKSTFVERVSELRPVANAGGLLSLGTWELVCGLRPYAGCANGLVDALLPLAEKKQGMAMVLLSVAYRNGIGIARDEKAADLLLDAADNRWWQRGATVEAARFEATLHPGSGTNGFEQRLARAQAAGNPEAGPLRIALSVEGASGRKVDAADIAELSKPENNAMGYGYRLIATSLRKQGDSAGANAWEDKAAAAGDGESSRRVAQRWLDAHPGQQADGATLDMLKRGAFEGDHVAMQLLAIQAIEGKHWRDAELQLLPAMIEGDADSTYMLLSLWEQGHKGLYGSPEKARQVYESLAPIPEGARARRALALMTLDGRAGIARDGTKARALIERDVRAGDTESQVMYATWLLYGMGGTKNVGEGRRLMEKAVASKSRIARLQYGTWLVQQSEARADHVRGLQLLQEADARGSTTARNNLAWAHCTSRFADLRDPGKGLQVSKRMQEIDKPLDPGSLDTVAACYAAAGQFDEAVRLQESVVSQSQALLADGGTNAQTIRSMSERLALFKKRQTYIEPATAGP